MLEGLRFARTLGMYFGLNQGIGPTNMGPLTLKFGIILQFKLKIVVKYKSAKMFTAI